MKWFERILVVVVILTIFYVGVGYFLPSDYHVSRSISINKPASEVYPLVADLSAWPQWGIWFQRDPDMTTEYQGEAFAVGHQVSWLSELEGNGQMTVTELMPNQQVSYSLEFPDMGMKSNGVLTLVEADGMTTVEWTNEGDVGHETIYKFFVLFMDDLVGPDFESGLSNLKQLAEK